VFRKLTAARSHVPCGQERRPVEKYRSRQTGREWLAEAADEATISIVLAIHLSTMINEERVGMPQFTKLLTATDIITDRENVKWVLTAQRHFRTSDCSKQRCIGNNDISSSVFEG